ncbi:MAG: hypothetical protein M1820_007877 [Bogoriella megaspora]|nr:MAG: hypothetical protein M1820_007877 [Bogoriella megaspora]
MYSPEADIATAVVFSVLGIVVVCMRFWVRLRFQPTYVGVDDILIVFGCFLVCGMGASQIVATILGDFSQETPATPERDYVEQKFNYINTVIEKPAFGFIKLSVLFFYRRIFSVRHHFRLFNTILIWLVAAWTLAFFWTEVFVCGTDFTVQWKNRKTAPQHCIDHGTELLVFGITDLVGDIIIVVMPFFCLRQMQMTSREKLGIGIVFLLGTLSTVAAAMRLGFVAEAYSIGQMGWVPPPSTKPEPGGRKHSVSACSAIRVINPTFWTFIEVAIGVLAACLPPLGPLIRRTPSPRKAVLYARRKLSLSSTRKDNAGSNTMLAAHELERGYSRETMVERNSSKSYSYRSAPSERVVSHPEMPRH